MTPSTLDLIQRTVKALPIPLVGAVAFDGNKRTKEVTPKCLAAFDEIFTLARPTSILEIGTHAGHSSCMMLAMTEARVTSVDIGTVWIGAHRSFADWNTPGSEGGLLYVERTLCAAFGEDRFTLIIGDSTAPATRTLIEQRAPFDFGFVDGDHSYDFVQRDIRMCLDLGIDRMVLDDFNDEASDTARAAREHGLVIERVWKDVHSGGVAMALARRGA